MTWKLLSDEPTKDGFLRLLTIEHKPGRLERFFGVRKHIAKYIGSGTVWHCADTGKRCSTMGECMLSDFDELREIKKALSP